MSDDLLIVDQLMLLLLDDDGASISGAGTLHYTLGGAVLAELALLELVQTDPASGGLLNGPVVSATASEAPVDPLLVSAVATVKDRPRRVQPLILKLGGDLRTEVVERLEQRGLIRKEQGRVLGFIRTTTWPAADERPEAELRRRILAVLEDGVEPDPRTAAVIALLYASGAMPALRPPLPWNNTTVTRAQQIQDGDWGATAVGTAVNRAAIAATVAAAAAAVSAATAVHG